MKKQNPVSQPPRWAQRLLRYFCDERLFEEIEGDLQERFQSRVYLFGAQQARREYVWEAVGFVRSFAFKRNSKTPSFFINSFSSDMIRNYFKIAFRNLWLNKAFTAINLLGLTIGTGCCLYILLYVRSQYGFDQQHATAGDIYRVATEVTEPGSGPFRLAPSSPPIAAALKRDFGEVLASTRLFRSPSEKPFLLKAGTNSVYEEKGYYVDSSFFDLFTYRFIEGSPLHALDEPLTVVLSSGTARKVFGNKAALNHSVYISNDLYRVTGVYDETFAKSHIRANFLMSFRAGGMIEFLRTSEQWVGQNLVHTYIRLQPGSNAAHLQAKLTSFLQSHGREQLAQVKIKKQLFLQPVTDIHLKSQLDSELEKNASPQFIRLMLLIAGLIQLMACINFMNMNTARSIGRAREVGVRKVMGASQSSLVGRFMGESVLLVAVSVALAVPAVWYLLPVLNGLLQAEFPVSFSNLGEVAIILLALIIVTGLLSGSYPAFYMTAYRAVNVLKGNLYNRYTSISLRKGLVVTQFVVSITLLIAIIVITRQLQSFGTRDLGFDRHQKIIIPFTTAGAQSQFEAFNGELLSHPSVKQTGGAAYYPSRWAGENMPMFYQAPGVKAKTGAGVWVNRINETFLESLHIPLLAGRNLTPADTNRQILVNEETLWKMAIPIEKAVGARLSMEYQDLHEDYTIIGVIKDFNIRSLKEPLRPLMLLGAGPGKLNYLIVDVQSESFSGLLDQMGKTWRKLVPGVPFTYSFLDADIAQQYEAENALLKIINGSALVAFLIAGLGLFGLAMFTAEQRTKEIGVRKVLGASVGSIVGLLSTDFLKLVVIAILIASPLAWYAMKRWLQDFAYKIEIEWWMFIIAGVSAIVIAMITVSFQSFRAALMNPVKSLQNE